MSRSETTDRHANARDRKRAKRADRDMVVTNRSIFTIRDTIGKKGREAAEKLGKRKAGK